MKRIRGKKIQLKDERPARSGERGNVANSAG
jgi:hypothetical protein